jgi:hypothetical protein
MAKMLNLELILDYEPALYIILSSVDPIIIYALQI